MNNNLPKLHLIYNRYKTASATRKGALEIRVTYNYKQKYISTGIMLYPHQWKNGTIINCSDALQLSHILDTILSEVRQILLEMLQEKNIDIFSISDRLKQKHQREMTFLDFCEKRAEVRKYGKAPDSQERYDRFIRLFKEWGKIIEFTDINESSIISYDAYLTSKNLQTYSKWNNYHRFLNSFIIDAIEEGLLHKNPYKWVNIAKGYSNKGLEKYLTPCEFRQVKVAKMPTKSLERVRDVFIFQTYTCLSYTDLKKFDAKLIQEVKGMKVYLGSRQKTDKPFTIPILSPAWDVIMKYEGKLPLISNPKYNEYLKVVAQSAGIDKPLSSHWARHTGATMLLNEGVDMRIVSKICGHSSTKITEQIYAKLLDETVIEAVGKVKDNL